MRTRTDLYRLAVKHFGEADGEEQFTIEHNDVSGAIALDNYFLRNDRQKRAYRFLFACRPGIAAEREVNGELRQISLEDAILIDINVVRRYEGNVTEYIVTEDYAVYAFGGAPSISPLPSTRN